MSTGLLYVTIAVVTSIVVRAIRQGRARSVNGELVFSARLPIRLAIAAFGGFCLYLAGSSLPDQPLQSAVFVPVLAFMIAGYPPSIVLGRQDIRAFSKVRLRTVRIPLDEIVAVTYDEQTNTIVIEGKGRSIKSKTGFVSQLDHLVWLLKKKGIWTITVPRLPRG